MEKTKWLSKRYLNFFNYQFCTRISQFSQKDHQTDKRSVFPFPLIVSAADEFLITARWTDLKRRAGIHGHDFELQITLNWINYWHVPLLENSGDNKQLGHLLLSLNLAVISKLNIRAAVLWLYICLNNMKCNTIMNLQNPLSEKRSFLISGIVFLFHVNKNEDN